MIVANEEANAGTRLRPADGRVNMGCGVATRLTTSRCVAGSESRGRESRGRRGRGDEDEEVAGEWWTCETRVAMKFWVAKTTAKSAYVSSRACETVSRGEERSSERGRVGGRVSLFDRKDGGPRAHAPVAWVLGCVERYVSRSDGSSSASSSSGRIGHGPAGPAQGRGLFFFLTM